jgi:hypothetical protein
MTYPSDPAASPTPAMPTADSLHCAPARTHTPLSGFLQRSRFSSALPQLSWLWHGYLAAGNITLLTSQWKSGKTTLLSVLLAKMAQGGVMAGLRVKPAKALGESIRSRAHTI